MGFLKKKPHYKGGGTVYENSFPPVYVYGFACNFVYRMMYFNARDEPEVCHVYVEVSHFNAMHHRARFIRVVTSRRRMPKRAELFSTSPVDCPPTRFTLVEGRREDNCAEHIADQAVVILRIWSCYLVSGHKTNTNLLLPRRLTPSRAPSSQRFSCTPQVFSPTLP